MIDLDDDRARETRIDALQKNAEWLAEHDLEDQTLEACKRLGIMQGDIDAIVDDLTSMEGSQ